VNLDRPAAARPPSAPSAAHPHGASVCRLRPAAGDVR
jgi:hypothetical protein